MFQPALGIVDVETALKEVDKDEELQKIISELRENPEGKQQFQWSNDQLRYKGRLVLSRKSSLIPSYYIHFTIQC